jgi:nucleotide-binding universal stress UspA family protein
MASRRRSRLPQQPGEAGRIVIAHGAGNPRRACCSTARADTGEHPRRGSGLTEEDRQSSGREANVARFTKLLLCVTEDDDATVRYVARLAAATNADLTIVDVIEDIPRVARRLLPDSWNLAALVRDQKQARIESSATLARRLGVRPTATLLSGSPIKALVREVVRGGHDLLAVGVASAGTVQCVGASATRLLREVPCPVLLVAPSRRRRRPRVLVAVDTDLWDSKGKRALTAKLVKTAVGFAEQHNGELHVLHAWVPYAERMIIRAGLTHVEAERFLASVREESRQDLMRALAPLSAELDGAKVHLVKGDPRVAIAEFATSHRIDLLVMGTVGRTGVAGRIIGNTAEAVLRQMPCSMLVLKPDDWSPRTRRSLGKSAGRHAKHRRVPA